VQYFSGVTGGPIEADGLDGAAGTRIPILAGERPGRPFLFSELIDILILCIFPFIFGHCIMDGLEGARFVLFHSPLCKCTYNTYC